MNINVASAECPKIPVLRDMLDALYEEVDLTWKMLGTLLDTISYVSVPEAPSDPKPVSGQMFDTSATKRVAEITDSVRHLREAINDASNRARV